MLLKDFKNKHRGGDIYVIASGKSLDYIDLSFFDGKICIGINQIYKKLLTNYLVRKESLFCEDVIKNLKKEQWLFIGKGYKKKVKHELIKRYKENDNVIFFDQINYSDKKLDIRSFPSNDDCLLVSDSTVTTGIYLAFYMGAKNIILVGHDCGMIDGAPNFSGYYKESDYKISRKNGIEDYKKWTKKIEKDTIALKKILKERHQRNVCSLNPFVSFNMEGHRYT